MNTEIGKYAAECLVDCLESYMEFVDIMAFNTKISNLPEQFVRQINTL